MRKTKLRFCSPPKALLSDSLSCRALSIFSVTILALVLLPVDMLRAQYSSGLIATPSANVLPPGQLSIQYGRSIPEWSQTDVRDPKGHSLSVGLGLFPGLEVQGRLVQGLRLPGRFNTSDQLVGLKYQLPIHPLPFQGRLAVGINDLSNRQSAFRQEYLVGTFALGPIDSHLGYGQSKTSHALSGLFGGVTLRITESLHLLADHDSHKVRTAIRFSPTPWSALPDWQPSITLGPNNAVASLTIDLDGRAMRRAMRPEIVEGHGPNWELGALSQEARYRSKILTAQDAAAIAESFRQQGFGEIRISHQSEGLSQPEGVAHHAQSDPTTTHWQIWAEPIFYRKNRMDGLGAALAAWLKIAGTSEQRVLITLTHLGQPILAVETSGLCIAIFRAGRRQCDLQDALVIQPTEAVTQVQGYPAVAQQSIWLRPQFTLGPALDLATGRESQLADTSTGLALGVELPLRPGLLLQGRWLVKLSDSPGFKGPESPFRQAGSGIEPGLDRLLLSVQRPWLRNTLWTELALGRHGHDLHGLLATASWSPDQGRFRITTQAGELGVAHRTLLATARFSVVPGRWALGLTSGQFLNEDVGYRLESRHQFGDNTLALYFQDTRDGNSRASGSAQAVGVRLSIALGPKKSWALGGSGATLRTTDHIEVALEKDPQGRLPLTASGNYGQLPPLAHGLLTDTLDRDRADGKSIEANLYRARAMLRELP